MDNSLHNLKKALADYEFLMMKLDRKREKDQKAAIEHLGKQGPTIRKVVEDRITIIKEELFFLDEQ
jgi:hypothetical protein